MITVTEEQLCLVEYWISQSTQGNHILFDLNLVRCAFAHPTEPMNDAEAKEVAQLIETLISLEGLNQQRHYVEALPVSTLNRVIKTYFNIVENKLFETTTVRH